MEKIVSAEATSNLAKVDKGPRHSQEKAPIKIEAILTRLAGQWDINQGLLGNPTTPLRDRPDSSQCGPTAEHQPISFLILPRELRDSVYDILWKNDPCLIAPYNGLLMELRYEGYYRKWIPHYGYETVYPPSRLPIWLLCGKTILQEGIQQFVRKSEWFYKGWLLRHTSKLSLLGDLSAVTSMTLYAGNLAALEDPPVAMGFFDSRELHRIADVTRQHQQNGGLAVEKLRIVGHSYSLPPRGDFSQAGNMIYKLLEIFQDINVVRFQFEIYDRSSVTRKFRRHVLYDVSWEGQDVKWVMVEDDLVDTTKKN